MLLKVQISNAFQEMKLLLIEKELNLQPAESSTSDAIDSSSGSTMSVDETDSGVDDGDDD